LSVKSNNNLIESFSGNLIYRRKADCHAYFLFPSPAKPSILGAAAFLGQTEENPLKKSFNLDHAN
jgi:hypothetical protein